MPTVITLKRDLNMESSSQIPYHIAYLQECVITLLSMLGVMTILHLLDVFIFSNKIKDNFALRAKDSFRPLTFFIAPFLHGNREHLIGNAFPFFSLGLLTMLPNMQDFYITTVITMILKGLATWLFESPNTSHLGSSSLIYGYFGFLLSRGFFTRDTGTILLALAVFLIPQSLTYQLFPNHPGVTRTGHFFGFLAGIASAWIVSLLPSV